MINFEENYYYAKETQRICLKFHLRVMREICMMKELLILWQKQHLMV